ncbi:MAG: hypothetical protein WA634_06425 [Silvibacterium sp.]
MKDKKDFFNGIASKLSILMGAAALVTTAQATSLPLSTPSAESNGVMMRALRFADYGR